ncbi:MAG: choice-of-anchor T family protein [Candidatus Thalassarchaeaceae archaeon]|nr:MAG: hypothetical protein CMA04_001965 [Euryarchaeota archaeon]RPG74302.1 MAG: hypothetical protein CBC45_004940 [Euryarchaeota archaeon TMED85]|tara:strand:- start:1592 stop:2524 length:933 start_codon:yes stop_codon:yes gene_type:complete
MNRLLLLSIFVLLIPNVGAQTSPLPSVSIDCQDGPHDIQVLPGSSNSVVVACMVYNDSLFTETIEFSVTSDVLSHSSPGSIDLNPGSEEEIEITFSVTNSHLPASISVDINASVTQANGAPCVFGCGEDSDSFDVRILQFAAMSVAPRTGTLDIEVDTSGEVILDITNKGNDEDEFIVAIENRSSLESLGFEFILNNTDILKSNEQTPYSFGVYASSEVAETNLEVAVTVTSSFDNKISETIQFTLRSDGAPEPVISLGSDDTALIYGGISVAGLLITILIIFIAMRSMRRRKVVTFNDDFEDFSDLDDF